MPQLSKLPSAEWERSLDNMVHSADESLRQIKSMTPKHTNKQPSYRSPTARSSSAPRASLKSNTTASDDTNRKLDFLLKKTKSLESSVSAMRTEMQTMRQQSKESETWALHMSESITMDKHTIAELREQISGLRQKMDRAAQREIIRDRAQDKFSGMTGTHVDVGAISEEVFARVHREFRQVVDEVVQACAGERADLFSLMNSRSAAEREVEDNELKKQINALRSKQQILEDSVADYKEMAKQSSALVSSMREAMHTSSLDTQSALESMSSRMNESLAHSATSMREEIHNRVESSLASSKQKIKEAWEGVSDLEHKVESLSRHCKTLDGALGEVREFAYKSGSDASHAVALATDGKRAISRVEEKIEESFQVPFHRSGSSHVGNPGGCLIEDRVDRLELRVSEVIAGHETKLETLTGALDAHRIDYQEALSRLSSAGRKVKAKQKELMDRLTVLGDVKEAVDRVLTDAIACNEEDRALLLNLKQDFAGVKDEVSRLRERMSSYEEKYITGEEAKHYIQDIMTAYHNSETILLDTRLTNLEKRVSDMNETIRQPSSSPKCSPPSLRPSSAYLHSAGPSKTSPNSVDITSYQRRYVDEGLNKTSSRSLPIAPLRASAPKPRPSTSRTHPEGFYPSMMESSDNKSDCGSSWHGGVEADDSDPRLLEKIRRTQSPESTGSHPQTKLSPPRDSFMGQPDVAASSDKLPENSLPNLRKSTLNDGRSSNEQGHSPSQSRTDHFTTPGEESADKESPVKESTVDDRDSGTESEATVPPQSPSSTQQREQMEKIALVLLHNKKMKHRRNFKRQLHIA